MNGRILITAITTLLINTTNSFSMEHSNNYRNEQGVSMDYKFIPHVKYGVPGYVLLTLVIKSHWKL